MQPQRYSRFRVDRKLSLIVESNGNVNALSHIAFANIAATDGLWVIWASLLISIHREIIVDYFHAN